MKENIQITFVNSTLRHHNDYKNRLKFKGSMVAKSKDLFIFEYKIIFLKIHAAQYERETNYTISLMSLNFSTTSSGN